MHRHGQTPPSASMHLSYLLYYIWLWTLYHTLHRLSATDYPRAPSVPSFSRLQSVLRTTPLTHSGRPFTPLPFLFAFSLGVGSWIIIMGFFYFDNYHHGSSSSHVRLSQASGVRSWLVELPSSFGGLEKNSVPCSFLPSSASRKSHGFGIPALLREFDGWEDVGVSQSSLSSDWFLHRFSRT